jgi:predicted porin
MTALSDQPLAQGARQVRGDRSWSSRLLLAGLIFVGSSAISDTASAQTAVLLYGIADGNLRFDHTNAGTLKSVGSGGGAGSRWGLKGAEDLGGGLKANFVFEQGFDLSDNSVPQGGIAGATPTSPTSSTGSRIFSRIATVGVSSDAWGNIRFGRDYKSIARLFVVTDAFGGGYVGSDGNVAPRLIQRYDNGIYYDSPTVGGLRLSLQLGLGESTTDTKPGTPKNAGNRFGGGLFYTHDRLTAGVAYSNYSAGVTSPLISSSLDHTRIVEAAATYDFDVIKLHVFSWSVKDDLGYHVRSGFLAISVPLEAWTLAAGYGHLNDLGASNATAPKIKTNFDANFFGALATYSFSRRTSVYVSAGAFKNRDKAGSYVIVDANSPSTGLFTATNIVGVNPWSTQTGMTHAF